MSLSPPGQAAERRWRSTFRCCLGWPINPLLGTQLLALYPRNELLKDQLQALVALALSSAPHQQQRAMSIATWFGPTPAAARFVHKTWRSDKRNRGFICPYLRCPQCDGDMVWAQAAIDAGDEYLDCLEEGCSVRVPGELLRLTRQSARRRPADLMLSTTESLNRQLCRPVQLESVRH